MSKINEYPYIQLADDEISYIITDSINRSNVFASAQVYIPTTSNSQFDMMLIGNGFSNSSTDFNPLRFRNYGAQVCFGYGMWCIVGSQSPLDQWFTINTDQCSQDANHIGGVYAMRCSINGQLCGIKVAWKGHWESGGGIAYSGSPTGELMIFSTGNSQYKMPKGTKLRRLIIGNFSGTPSVTHHFVPAKAKDGQGCLYDKITNKFFKNNGSGYIKIVGDSQYIQK